MFRTILALSAALPFLTACGGDPVREGCINTRSKAICEVQHEEGYMLGLEYEGRCEEVDEELSYPDSVRANCEGMLLCQATCEEDGESCWRDGLIQGYAAAGCEVEDQGTLSF